MGIIFKDNQFSYQLLRILGEVSSKVADINEVISTTQNITEGDFDSWCREWTITAKRIHAFADECYNNGNMNSAKGAYLRASNYYRIAEFYLHEDWNDERIEELYDTSLDCFAKVIELSNQVIEEVKIPYEGMELPGHFYNDKNIDGPKPIIIAMTGYDGTKEELYGLAMSALEHGMCCLTFEGPGQGEVIRKKSIYFRPDYEKVVAPIVDYLLSRNEVDACKIILWGESFGGYLAPRAAAYEHRLAACIANGGVYDLMGFRRPPNITRSDFYKYIRANNEDTNKRMYKNMEESPEIRWAISHGMYVFGVKSPADYTAMTEEYWLEGIAEKVECPTLVVDAENEKFFPGQAKKLYDELKCKKHYLLFSSNECASEHCQVGARLYSNARIFNWIERVLQKANKPEEQEKVDF